ncbi:MAG TPA: diaminopimelate epimerase [Candidatus Polarisedimenticolia bacterium]
MSWPFLEFTKMSAGGNDFVVLDRIATARAGAAPAIDRGFVRRVCARALSVGADGLILIEPAGPGHVKMIYFNADGGRAALCGNGVRCVARLAALRGHAPAEGMVIETDAGPLQAAVEGARSWFRLPLGVPEVRQVVLRLRGGAGSEPRGVEGTWVMAGVPHVVVAVPDAHAMTEGELRAMAPAIRAHPDLGPEGANVDFITIRGRHALDLRCWERGVEGETLSSGSGCIASAMAVTAAGLAWSPVDCRSRAGFVSTVTIEPGEGGTCSAVLSGDARIVYDGVLSPEALEGFTP